jgi:hypothetical protein
MWCTTFCLQFVVAGCWADVERSVLFRTYQRSDKNFLDVHRYRHRLRIPLQDHMSQHQHPHLSKLLGFQIWRFAHASCRLALLRCLRIFMYACQWQCYIWSVVAVFCWQLGIIRMVRCSNLRRRNRFLAYPKRPDWLWSPPGFLPGVTAAGAWSWHPPSAEVNNERSCTLQWRGQTQPHSLHVLLCRMAVA